MGGELSRTTSETERSPSHISDAQRQICLLGRRSRLLGLQHIERFLAVASRQNSIGQLHGVQRGLVEKISGWVVIHQ